MTVGSCGQGSIDAQDLDGDGDRDVVLTEEQGCFPSAPPRIFIFRNNGNANFSLATTLLPPGFAVGISIADVTGDGKPDLVTSLGAGMGVFPGNRDLTFGSPIISSSRAFKFTIADINRDGRPDVGMILPQNAFGTVQVATALGNGNGTFSPAMIRNGSSVLETLRISNDIDAADANGDQRPDLIVTNNASNDVSVFLANADGSLQPHQRYGAGYSSSYSTVNDFTGDGRPDIAVVIGLQTGVVQSGLVLLRNTVNTSRRGQFDFDGDGKADLSVFRPSNGAWYLQNSSSGFFATHFGLGSDKIVPADFDGDGRTDIAVYRDGVWYWLASSNGSFNAYRFGQAGDVPVSADYTGDGRAELAVYRGGTWFTMDLSTNQFQTVQFGMSSDKPVPGDYDGDNKADVAVFRDGVWYMLRSTAGFAAVQFGVAGDKPVVGDFDGDSKADQAVYRSGVWYILRSSQGFMGIQFGIATDDPVAADYDGDGKADIAVFRDGVWYLLRSQAGYAIAHFGTSGDRPGPAAYIQ